MGLGLLLTASLEAGLETVMSWARERIPEAPLTRGRNVDGHDTLFWSLHPTAEDVELSFPAPGRIAISAKRSTTGPGYHAWLVSLLDNLKSSLHVTWDPPPDDGDTGDETDYFISRDEAELDRQMLLWLRAVASDLATSDGANFDVAMPLGRHFEMPGHSRTPLGPRSLEYWRGVAEDPQRGVDFFAWWERGQGAGYWLGVALALMWTEICWRAPINEDEKALLKRGSEALEKAYALDSRRAYPWREWAEILDLLEHDGELAARVRARARTAHEGPLIGYRRHPTRVPLTGGWSIRLPGEFAEKWDEGTFTAWSGDRTVWFTSYSVERAHPPSIEELRSYASPASLGTWERIEQPLIGLASLERSKENDEEYWSLSTHTAIQTGFVICTICFVDDGDRDWALSTWRSIQHRGSG
ncbi:MAG TPA: hypothetical protein VE964_16930 [Myxococcales bacterium]|nr:hypothetical protein [Myxococcales bacterium]